MDLLQVVDIFKKDSRGFELENIRFTQLARQNLTIAGETGSGKTTLLKIIAGLSQPDSGKIIFKNELVIGPADKLIPGHQGIAYLSQQFELPHFLRVSQVLEYANEWEPDAASELFRICKIDHLMHRRTDQLSGGEMQRIAIARLLITQPALLLLDEPFSNIDQANKSLLKSILYDIGETMQVSFLMVTHDPADSLSWSDQILVIRGGNIIQRGTPEQVYGSPATTYTAGLFGSYNVVPFSLSQYYPVLAQADRTNDIAIVRPEDLVLRPGTGGHFTARVKRRHYFGHYYEYELEMDHPAMKDVLPTARTTALIAAPGDLLGVSIHEPSIKIVSRDRA